MRVDEEVEHDRALGDEAALAADQVAFADFTVARYPGIAGIVDADQRAPGQGVT